MNATLPSETQLVRALQQHRYTDFVLLYDTYAPALYGMLLRLVKDPAYADDLLQKAFVKIWSTSQGYDSRQGRLFSWLFATTRNLALDELAARGIRLSDQAYRHEWLMEFPKAAPAEATVRQTRSACAVWKLA